MNKVYRESTVSLPLCTPDGETHLQIHEEFKGTLLSNFDGFTVVEGTQMRSDPVTHGVIHDPVALYSVLMSEDGDEEILKEFALDCAYELDQDNILFKDTFGVTHILVVEEEDYDE